MMSFLMNNSLYISSNNRLTFLFLYQVHRPLAVFVQSSSCIESFFLFFQYIKLLIDFSKKSFKIKKI